MVLTDILVSEVLQPRGAYLVEVVENRLSHLASEPRRERKLKFTSDIKAIGNSQNLHSASPLVAWTCTGSRPSFE